MSVEGLTATKGNWRARAGRKLFLEWPEKHPMFVVGIKLLGNVGLIGFYLTGDGLSLSQFLLLWLAWTSLAILTGIALAGAMLKKTKPDEELTKT